MSPTRKKRTTITALEEKRIRYHLKLDYPLHITLVGETWRGRYTDLPGVELEDVDLSNLQERMDELRRMFIVEAVLRGMAVPLPYSEGRAEPIKPVRTREESTA